MAGTVTLAGLKNCDGCRKALKWCEANDVPHRFADIREADVLAQVLERLTNHPDWQSFVNKRSTTWRQIPAGEREPLTHDKALALMTKHPTLIKRPVMLLESRTLAGFQPDALGELK